MVSLIPTDDPKQALRIRRFLIAAGSYLMWTALVGYCVLAGYFRLSPGAAAAWFITGLVLLNLVLYGVFRSGLNTRFKDPSLTMLQMGVATMVVMITIFCADEKARDVLLLIYPVVFVFGFFRLNLRQFLTLTGLALAGYVSSVYLISIFHPGTVAFSLEGLRFTILAMVLLWFSMVGAYVNRLRQEVIDANAELQEAVSTIQELAVRDSLSGVYNRRKLLEVLEQERGRAGRGGPVFAICLFDMDRFKEVNDTFGHLKGDVLLRAFGKEIATHLRAVDLIGRYGGDEFVVVLPQTELEGALAFAERAVEVTRGMRFLDMPEDFRITVSVGVTVYRKGLTVEELISMADVAMYRAKEQGRNRVEFKVGGESSE